HAVFLSFVVMPWRPLQSTLFPYTTLFRSEIAYPDEDLSWRNEWEHFAEAVEADDGRRLLGDLQDARYAWTQVEAAYASGQGTATDRKSTRLNSSHVSISYAVFCLKKKRKY